MILVTSLDEMIVQQDMSFIYRDILNFFIRNTRSFKYGDSLYSMNL